MFDQDGNPTTVADLFDDPDDIAAADDADDIAAGMGYAPHDHRTYAAPIVVGGSFHRVGDQHRTARRLHPAVRKAAA